MAITVEDINLKKFLEKFTFTNEVGKINIDVALYMNIAAQLRISLSLDQIRRTLI